MSHLPTRRVSTLAKACSICGHEMRVIVYSGGSYRGGHFFGRIQLYNKKDVKKAIKDGTKRVVVHGFVMDVMKHDPKPYAEVEYWECPKCYWRY